MVVKVGTPSWEDGLACPYISVDGLDPAQQARELIATLAANLARASDPRGLVSRGVVDHVFAVVQLALDDRPAPATAASAAEDGANRNSREAEEAFRSALSPGALGLLPKLTAALQPRRESGGDVGAGGVDNAAQAYDKGNLDEKGGGGLRGAVVQAASHFTAMEQLVARQNNTPALLMAHNGLAKLLKNNWPWLLGGVVDAPRLLSRLCEIYRDGLGQLTVAMAQADTKRAAFIAAANGRSGSGSGGEAVGAAEIAHLKKFGKLLATFGTRMACLLRHLGQECSQQERRGAYQLYAKAVAAVYPGLVASLRENYGVDGDGPRTRSPAGVPSSVSLSGSVAGEIIYPKAVEAFLSTTDRPPCSTSASGRILTAAAVGAMETTSTSTSAGGSGSGSPAQRSCRCYEGEGTTGELSGRCHDPREALKALRPTSRSPPYRPHRTDPTPGDSRLGSHGRDGNAGPGSSGKCGGDDSDVHVDVDRGEPAMAVAVDPLGAVLLLCEVLRNEGRVSAVGAVGRECCGWVLDHLAALFPGWVEAASSASPGDDVDADAGRASGQGMASALCDEVATALGLFVCRRALNGDFQEAQVQLIEGCASHPHPACREVWIGALKVFLARCDAAAQELCIQSLADAALDPRVSRRCRRRLGRALSAVCAATAVGGPGNALPRLLLLPGARAVLVQSCLSWLRDGNPCGSSGNSSNDSGSNGGDGGGGGVGACVLDLLRSLAPWRSSAGVGDGSSNGSDGLGSGGEELAAAAVSFARSAVTNGLRDAGGKAGGGRGGGNDTVERWHNEESLAAAAMFLAARSEPAAEPDLDDRSGGDSGRRGGNHNRVFPRGEVEKAAREAGEKLGGMLSAGLSGRTLSAMTRLLSKTNPDRMSQLCALIVAGARAGTVGGEGLLALAESLTSVGRPLPLTAVAKCVDPGIAELLPRLVPKNLLPVFKSRVAKSLVYSDGGRPVELEIIQERGLAEMRILTAAAALAEGKRKISSAGQAREMQLEVVLKEGSELSVLAGLLGCSVAAVRLVSEDEGGGVCLTLRENDGQRFP